MTYIIVRAYPYREGWVPIKRYELGIHSGARVERRDNVTSQKRWHAFVHCILNEPDTLPVPQVITLRMCWNSSSTFSHCDDGELMRMPILSSGYMQCSLRSIMASAKPHVAVLLADPLLLLSCTVESSVAITPQTKWSSRPLTYTLWVCTSTGCTTRGKIWSTSDIWCHIVQLVTITNSGQSPISALYWIAGSQSDAVSFWKIYLSLGRSCLTLRILDAGAKYKPFTHIWTSSLSDSPSLHLAGISLPRLFWNRPLDRNPTPSFP